jgi:tRNA A37 threonylcarbamoyladenosine synthetase subunit TsaC/SUA5/YrdC
MPLHPIAIELLRAVGPLAVVTANRVGEPAPTDCDGAQRQLGDFVAVYLDAGPCEPSAVSTIVDLTGPPRVLRLGALSLEDLRAVAPDTELA